VSSPWTVCKQDFTRSRSADWWSAQGWVGSEGREDPGENDSRAPLRCTQFLEPLQRCAKKLWGRSQEHSLRKGRREKVRPASVKLAFSTFGATTQLPPCLPSPLSRFSSSRGLYRHYSLLVTRFPPNFLESEMFTSPKGTTFDHSVIVQSPYTRT